MKFLYKLPGYILLLFGGFCLSWGGLIVRSFETANAWEILFLRSFFFFIGVTVFLFATYRNNSFKIVKDSGIPGFLGGFVMSLSFIAFIFAMMNTSVANVVFIISTQTMFLATLGYFYLNEKISLIGFISIILAMTGITIMIGDSVSTETLFGNLIALAIPINFSIFVMIVRKNSDLDMVPVMWYAAILSLVYGLIMTESFVFSSHDLLMGFLLGVPQLTIGFICITIGTRTTRSVTVGLLMLTETLFAPLWVWMFLNEIPPTSVFIGGAIIILAIVIKSLDKSRKIIH